MDLLGCGSLKNALRERFGSGNSKDDFKALPLSGGAAELAVKNALFAGEHPQLRRSTMRGSKAKHKPGQQKATTRHADETICYGCSYGHTPKHPEPLYSLC